MHIKHNIGIGTVLAEDVQTGKEGTHNAINFKTLFICTHIKLSEDTENESDNIDVEYWGYEVKVDPKERSYYIPNGIVHEYAKDADKDLAFLVEPPNSNLLISTPITLDISNRDTYKKLSDYGERKDNFTRIGYVGHDDLMRILKNHNYLESYLTSLKLLIDDPMNAKHFVPGLVLEYQFWRPENPTLPRFFLIMNPDEEYPFECTDGYYVNAVGTEYEFDTPDEFTYEDCKFIGFVEPKAFESLVEFFDLGEFVMYTDERIEDYCLMHHIVGPDGKYIYPKEGE